VDRRAAERAMDALIDETERALVEVRPNHQATFADAVAEWREWAEQTKRLKPATLRSYDALLAAAGLRPRNGGPRAARIMRAFADRRIAEITTAEIERFLRGLDRDVCRRATSTPTGRHSPTSSSTRFAPTALVLGCGWVQMVVRV